MKGIFEPGTEKWILNGTRLFVRRALHGTERLKINKPGTAYEEPAQHQLFPEIGLFIPTLRLSTHLNSIPLSLQRQVRSRLHLSVTTEIYDVRCEDSMYDKEISNLVLTSNRSTDSSLARSSRRGHKVHFCQSEYIERCADIWLLTKRERPGRC